MVANKQEILEQIQPGKIITAKLLTDITNLAADAQTSADTAKEDIKATLPTLQSQVAEVSAQLEHKANKSETQNIQQQINNLVLGAVGDGNNAEVVQARGNSSTLNDRISNVEIVKSFKDVTLVNDISYGLSKNMNFTMSGFNGSDLVKIPTTTFGSKTNFTVIFKATSNKYTRLAFKIYDNTWGSGKVNKDLSALGENETKVFNINIDTTGYDSFALLRLVQVGTEYNATINIDYIKVVETTSINNINNIDELFSSYGDVKTYIKPELKLLPSNLLTLLEKERIPSNVKTYIDNKTIGNEALQIFDVKTMKDNIFNHVIPSQVTTNDGNGTQIINIQASELVNLSEQVTLVIKYKLNTLTTVTRHTIRIFDSNWGAGKTISLDGNDIIGKDYFVTYTFNKSQFKDWVLFRFAMNGTASSTNTTVLDIEYVKLFNAEEFVGIDELENLTKSLGKLEVYPIVDFKVIPKSLSENLNKDSENIVMIGDSIANQFAGVIASNNGTSEYNFMNKCIGGESTLDTMARLGAIPYVVLPPFTIPASTSNSGDVSLVSSLFLDVEFNSVTAKPTWKNGYLSNYSATPEGLNPVTPLRCEIAGVKGTLYFKRATGTTTYFKRDEAGSEIIIDRPTEVIPIDTSAYDKDAIYTCFMGTNEGWCNRFFEKGRTTYTAGKTDADLLFSYYKRIAQHINTNKFLFMGFYMSAFLDQTTGENRNNWWNYFEELMSKEFGNKYFSVRKYLRELGYKDANVQLTAQDLQDIKDGKIPIMASTGSANGVHVTSRMSACVGNEILKRLKNLGYIDSYNKIDVSKYDNGQVSTNPDDFLPPQE